MKTMHMQVSHIFLQWIIIIILAVNVDYINIILLWFLFSYWDPPDDLKFNFKKEPTKSKFKLFHMEDWIILLVSHN